MVTAVASLVGIAAGALLQYFFTKYLEERRHLRELRTAAYTDFLFHLAQVRYNSSPTPAPKDILAHLTESKARICLYGSPRVVEALAEFHRVGAVIESPEQIQKFIAVVSAMRGDSLTDRAVSALDFESVLIRQKNKAA